MERVELLKDDLQKARESKACLEQALIELESTIDTLQLAMKSVRACSKKLNPALNEQRDPRDSELEVMWEAGAVRAADRETLAQYLSGLKVQMIMCEGENEGDHAIKFRINL